MRAVAMLLLAAVIALPVFAFDAQTLQPGLLRVSAANSLAIITGAYGTNGSYQAWDQINMGFNRTLNTGVALELGVFDWMSLALDYTRGWTYWTYLYFSPPMDKGDINGLNDLLLEVKFRIIGEKAPIRHERLRVSASPIIQIPMPGPDWKKQTENQLAGKGYTIAELNTHAFGLGGRAYADILFFDWLTLNGFGEILGYLPVEKASLGSGGTGEAKNKYEYGFAFSVGGGPQARVALGSSLTLSGDLPLRLAVSPRLVKDGGAQYNGRQWLYAEPKLAARFHELPVPLEIELDYRLPLAGMGDFSSAGADSAYADHIITLVVKIDFKLF